MRFAWTFNFDVMNYNLAGVLWMIGWSMVALAGLVWLPFKAIAAIGLDHRLRPQPRRSVPARSRPRDRRESDPLDLAVSLLRRLGHARRVRPRIAILYSLMPWIGVMAAGYAFGRVLQWPIERRNRACLAIGGARDRAVHRAADIQHLRRSAAVERASNRSRSSTPTKYPGVAAVPADDARAADRVDAARSSAPAARSPTRSSCSAACRSSITCCTFR